MKKVTILALHLGYDGIAKSIVHLANCLCSKYDVEIVCSYKLYDKPSFPLDSRVNVNYLIETRLPVLLQDYNTLLKQKSFIQLNKRINEEYITKNKTKKLFKDTYAGISIYNKRAKTMKHFIKMCDSDIIISTKDVFHKWLSEYGSDDALKIGWEHEHHHGNKQYVKKFIGFTKNLDYLVVVSKNLKDYYSHKLKKCKCECVYIPNALDRVLKVGSKLNNPRMISTGNLIPEKSHFDMLEIFKKVNEKYPEWKLDIIGDGVLKPKLKEFVKDNDIENVKFYGFRDRDFISDSLRNSSIFLMTSITESFGITLIEAMNEGLPCIAFDSAEGAREIIENGYNGFLIKNRNIDDYVSKVEELINDEKLRKKMGDNAKKFASRYDIKYVSKEWLDLLNKAV
jgi:N-acetylglucosaminyldiphosphoundecaprenol N-acetyl-beta-D-mannosaminyltransferase